jgi:hypothetical protein
VLRVQDVDECSRKRGTLARRLVLEIHKHVAARSGLVADDLRPASDVFGAVPFVK